MTPLLSPGLRHPFDDSHSRVFQFRFNIKDTCVKRESKEQETKARHVKIPPILIPLSYQREECVTEDGMDPSPVNAGLGAPVLW